MIQQPLHATPENYAVANGAYFKFTFAGDMMSYCTYKVFDYNTGLPVTADFYKYSTSTYNGDDVETTLINLPNGKDCIWQVALAQHTQGDTIEPIYDMPVLSGTISEISGTSLTIEKDISSIYEWWSDGQNRIPCYYEDDDGENNILAYGMIIKIGSESRLITSYNPETGILQIENSFNQTIISGTRYKIYSNYVISPQYFFKTRTKPIIDLTQTEFVSYLQNALWCRANYSQAENSLIKYCNLELYWANNSDFNNIGTHKSEKIAQSPKIYSQNAVYYFENIYRHDTEHDYNDYYKIVCNVVTQDDYVTSSEYVIERPISSGNGRCTIKYEIQKDSSVYVFGIASSIGESSGRTLNRMVLRENMDTGETVCISGHYDYTASTKGNYKYTVLGFESSNTTYGVIGSYVPNAVMEKEVNINLSGYYIMDLNYNQTYRGQEYYTVSDVWHFVGDINDTTITQNRDTILHVGAAQYPIASNTDTNYMSGTLSAMIGYVNCETKEYVDNITLVNAWRKFITQDKIYLLKSQKGDVWVVNIIDNPETTYQENYYKIPTTFSFSWAECCNINDIEIRKE